MFSEVIGLQIVQKGDDKELARRTKKTDSSKSASSPCMSLCMLSWSCIVIVIAAEDECIFSKRANVFEELSMPVEYCDTTPCIKSYQVFIARCAERIAPIREHGNQLLSLAGITCLDVDKE